MGHTALRDQALRYVWEVDMEQRDCRNPCDHPHQNQQAGLDDYSDPQRHDPLSINEPLSVNEVMHSLLTETTLAVAEVSPDSDGAKGYIF